ncbi:polynucleotide 3'-phosphatase ZDP isoform X1 [Typha angustifolia]|uniref:polynucleotide 3'-phosphatase ZDP isoform X1 n=1 Tax=Typha angustifolia TaxID=59011 RepID=UPI003C2BF5E6
MPLLLLPHLSILPKNPNFLNFPFLASFSLLSPLSSPSPMAPPRVVAEYAKSSRSSCKSCGKAISVGSLRLGSSAKDPRGFDLVKWFHLDCFPARSHPIAAAEEIKGFGSLKNCDQETLKKLEGGETSDEADKVCKRDGDLVHELEEIIPKKPKVHGTGEAGDEEPKADRSEQVKLSGDSQKNGLGMVFSDTDIIEKYKDATLPPNWKAYKTVIFRERENGLHDSTKIAAFDFDGCLVNTSVKRSGADAWSLLYPSIPAKLQGLYHSGYKLVIFTNESNIERWKNKRQQAVDSKIGRLDNFINCVKVPIQVFIACGLAKNKDQTDDPFRKPKPGMWRLMEEHFNSGMPIDMDQSFYVGDAAGRATDHSDADIQFAEVIGLKFHVPEDFFAA